MSLNRPLPDVPGIEHRYVDTDRMRFHTAQAGSGPPVLLLHTWPQHWWAWRKVLPLLAGDHREPYADMLHVQLIDGAGQWLPEQCPGVVADAVRAFGAGPHRQVAAAPRATQLPEGVATMTRPWPSAELDPIRRLRVMAAVLPGAVHAELVVPVPFDRAWTTTADLETALPPMIRDFRRVAATEVDAERLRLDVRGRLGQRARFDVVRRPGWCWMQSRRWVGGLAARPDPDGTRIGFLGVLRVPGAGLLVRGRQPAARRLGQGALARSADEIERRDQPR